MNIPQKPRKLIKFLELPIALAAYISWSIISVIAFIPISALILWKYESFDYFFHLRIILMLIIYKIVAVYIGKINFGLKKIKDRVEKTVQGKAAMIPKEQQAQVKQLTNSLNGLLGMVFDHSKCVRYFTIGVAIRMGIMLISHFNSVV